MRRILSGWSVVALFVAGTATLQAATERLPDDAVLVERVSQPDADARATTLQAAVVAGRSDEALATFEAIDDPLTREAIAARLLDRLQQTGNAIPDTLLDAIAAWPVRVYTRHEETAADWFVPVFDLPGRVQSLRLLAARATQVQTLQTALSGKTGDDALTQLSAAPPQIAAQAVATLPATTFRTVRSHAKAATTPLPSPVLAALARRAGDADSLLLAIDHAEPLDVLPLFASTLPSLPTHEATRVLDAALAHPDYASAAALALARRDATTDDLTRLRSLLASPSTGASVAAALAQHADGLARIDTLLATADDPVTLTHLALALRLQGSYAATQRLHRLREDTRLPAHVRAELQR